MKRAISLIIAAVLVLSLAGCAAEKPDEKIYVLSRDRDAVWLVGADGAEKVMDVPEDALSASLEGGTLWYANETKLVRVGAADGSRTEFDLPASDWKGRIVPAGDEAYIALKLNGGGAELFESGFIYRVGADGAELVTEHKTSLHWPFTVDGSSVYFTDDRTRKIFRVDPDGKLTRFEREGASPWPTCISSDGGRLYVSWIDHCFSYDAATGGDEREETIFGPVSPSPTVIKSVDYVHSALAHDGWLYYGAGDPSGSEVWFMGRRIADGKTVRFGTVEDVFFYSFDSVVTFGEQGFVVADGYQKEVFRYFPYYSGK